MDARDSVIELALRLAEKIIHRQLQVDNQVIVDQVTAALKSLTGATNLSIHINPDDRPVMTEVMPQLIEVFSQFKHMRIVDDENIGRGGCILIHEHGRLDASLETQLRRAVELLLPGDLEVDPDPDPVVETQASNDTEVQSQIHEDAAARQVDVAETQQTQDMQASEPTTKATQSLDTPEIQPQKDVPSAELGDPLSDALDQADIALDPTASDQSKLDTSTES